MNPVPGTKAEDKANENPHANGAGHRDSVLRVCFWGTRGSIPTPGWKTVRYGGNTSCTQIGYEDCTLILDAGTGIRELGEALLNKHNSNPIRAHIFIGHTHWDHIQGFPFFRPAYRAGNEFRLYSVGRPLEKILHDQMNSRFFPVAMSDLKAELRFIKMSKVKPVVIGGLTVDFEHLNHPGGAVGFRVSAASKTIVYLSDHESFSRMYGEQIGAEEDMRIETFVRGADLLICDAQYTEEEYSTRKGWGHSTFEDTLGLAVRGGVRQLAICHHDPSHDDAFLDVMLEKCHNRVRADNHSFQCFGAHEGQMIEI